MVWGLVMLFSIGDAVSTPAVMRHNQRILNLCLQLLRTLTNFIFGLNLSLAAEN